MLSHRDVEMYLAEIEQIRQTHDLIDVHVHPFEVMYNDLKYKKQKSQAGLYSSSVADYQQPRPTAVMPATALSEKCKNMINEELKSRCFLLTSRQLYLHTGPRVFADQMAISGVAKVLLLPVMGPDETNDEQMSLMSEMFGQNDCRFDFGYCVPNYVENEQIGKAISAAARKYNIKALKIHPAVTGINLNVEQGVDRVERMLQACRDNDLSVIVHGGSSPAAKVVEARGYSVLSNLQKVNWSLAETPVIIAHAGAFGSDDKDFLQSTISLLSKMMSQHDNLFADMSGVDFSTLCHMLRTIETERIVFGSDCLYYPQWKTIVCLFHALNKTVTRGDEAFVRIASTNPMKILGYS